MLSNREMLLASGSWEQQDGQREAWGKSWLMALAQPQGLVCQGTRRAAPGGT